jgi:hypothetical protein
LFVLEQFIIAVSSCLYAASVILTFAGQQVNCHTSNYVTIMFLQVQEFAENSDSILLVVLPAASVREVGTSKALKLAQELDSDGTPTINMFVFLS